ncbi:flagellar basal-body rod protein FlgC [Duganella sacchari]|uniref:Flagellar basal-body rod protein FlgC n=1 Tax=Duganella sacchari TaxID=551987 RepID=A0A1M7PLB3_9BURK|nr:flagellar basal body rod protein FlgC [Duganella sacchari]SHN18070.1 flagellar basal-body rod protein FlgC [Duganella sacchari]
MDYSQSFAISAAGMQIERSRVDVAALNLANANTVVGADGQGYHPMRVLARHVGLHGASFASLLALGQSNAAGSVVSVEPSEQAPREVYEPGNPLANARGVVTYAGVDAAAEMTTIMAAMRSYEANVAAMNAARSMALKTLDIGG